MSDDCLFCKIVRKEINAKEVLRDEHVVAFHDLNPQAPTHVLVIPTVHAEHLSEFTRRKATPRPPAGCSQRRPRSASNSGPDGYRVVMNEGRDAGQSVFHLHAHVLAGPVAPMSRRLNSVPRSRGGLTARGWPGSSLIALALGRSQWRPE